MRFFYYYNRHNLQNIFYFSKSMEPAMTLSNFNCIYKKKYNESHTNGRSIKKRTERSR